MTIEELNKEYGYPIMPTRCINPTHKKWVAAAWEIECVYGHVENGTLSLGKAREFTTAIIEKYVEENKKADI